MNSNASTLYVMPHGLMIVWSILLSVVLVLRISPVDGRRHSDYWRDRKVSSHRSLARHSLENRVTIAYNSRRYSALTITDDEGDTISSIPSHFEAVLIESESSSPIDVTPTSVVNDDRLSNDINFVPNTPLDLMNASDRTITSRLDTADEEQPVRSVEESVVRLKYESGNHIDKNNDDNDDGDDESLKSRSPSSISSGSDTETNILFPPLQTPIVYRYYPRHQSRTISAGSVPFVLLGPNVDHWKLVAQQLSLRGFNVIAVGPKDQVLPTTTTTTSTSSTIKTKPSYELGLASLSSVGAQSMDNNSNDRYLEGPGLVLQLLDTLRWKKIILVGCDSEAALAIQAAILLPSDRIAGLILCGNMQESETTFLEYGSYRYGLFELDRFLQERLSCPFTIVWDGTNEHATVSSTTTTMDAVPKMSSKSIMNVGRNSHRSVIIGGGTSPHRRRPGIFAWILTRFVEERIAPAVSIQSSSSTATSAAARTATTSHIPSSSYDTAPRSSVLPTWLSSLPLWKLPARIPLLWNVDDMFNEESMVVFGRIVATAIFYAISLKVLVYQYGNIRDIIDVIASVPRQIVYIVRDRIYNIATMVLFIGRIPFRVLPFGKRIPVSRKNNVTGTQSEGTKSSLTDESGEQLDNAEDDHGTSEAMTDNDLRPFFFLDNVVA